MTLAYGFVKAKIVSRPVLKPSRNNHEIQYHLDFNLLVDGARWDVAVNVGTNDDDDLLKYKFAFDFRHSIIQTLAAAQAGARELSGQTALPALDFMRSDVLANTGKWRDSDVMDGSEFPKPAASLKRLLEKAQQQHFDVYVFGRFYKEGDALHDTHMNQGSTKGFLHKPADDSNDHNDVWQDGAVMVDVGEAECGSVLRGIQSAIGSDRRRRQPGCRRGSDSGCVMLKPTPGRLVPLGGGWSPPRRR